MTKFEEFKQVYTEVMTETKKEVLSYDWADKAFYTAWVGQIYHFLCESTRMIPFAASQFRVEDEELFNRCIEHSMEERGHHMMAINDLKVLGSRLQDHEVLWPTEQLFSYPYHLTEKVDPIAIFGISAYMEGIAVEVGNEVTETVVEAFGKKAATFLLSHVQDDENHIEEAFGALKTCPESRLPVVMRSFLGANQNFLDMLKQVHAISRQATHSPSLQATA